MSFSTHKSRAPQIALLVRQPLSSTTATLATTFVHQGVAHWVPTWTLSRCPLADHKCPIMSALGPLSCRLPIVREWPIHAVAFAPS